MAEEAQYSFGIDSTTPHKCKYDDQPNNRPTGFSVGPATGIELAKQRAQEVAARLLSGAPPPVDANKRPRPDSDFDSLDNIPFRSTLYSSVPPVSYAHQGTSKKIDIPNGRVGVIIGKAGETIKYLQLQSGAKIQVTRDMDADPNSLTRMVELMGTPDAIACAEKLINEVLAEAESRGSGIIARRLTGQSGSDEFFMKIPNNKVIPLHLPPGDPSTERTLKIDGTPEQIESAKQLVNQVISGEGYSVYWTIGDTNMNPFVGVPSACPGYAIPLLPLVIQLIVLEILQCLVVILSKVTNLDHPLTGLLLPQCSNLAMVMCNLEHTLVHHPSITCLRHHMEDILLSNLVDIPPIGTSLLHHLISSLLMLAVMITIVNNHRNHKILGVQHLQWMALRTITVRHLPLVIINLDRVMGRITIMLIMCNHNQGMDSHRHTISSKAMAQLLVAMAVVITLHKKATLETMLHKEIQLKLHRLNLLPPSHNKVILPANILDQTLPVTHLKGLRQVMGFPQHPKQLMAINHNLAMEPLNPKSWVALRLFMDSHSLLAQ
ncbi:hypothetical protein Fmac_000532 [Flemingia macrophylla]|uniref:K Homology domain-containing protein n=1 Tax=Flemingia macrophylla TaxID=520843 RepID=A0ABD1NFT1_9FABA